MIGDFKLNSLAARPGLKYQPKVKPTSVPSTTPPDDGRQQAFLQTYRGSDVERLVEPVDVGDVDKRSEDPIDLSSSVRASGEVKKNMSFLL